MRSIYRPHPFLNTAAREGAATEVFGKRASINSLGYRSPERPGGPAPDGVGTRRVLFAGGSTTFDILAPDDESTWPWRVETLLRARGEEVEVWNAGFPGWTSLENLISLAVRDLDLAPELVVIYQGINDLQPAGHFPFDRQYEHGHAELARRALGLELEPPPWHARSILAEKVVAALAGPADPWRSLAAEAPAAGRLPRIPDVAVATFQRNVRSAIALAHGHGARVILATQPIRLRQAQRESDLRYLEGWLPGLEAAAAPAELERLNQVLRDLAGDGLAELADVAAEVPWNDEDFGDPLHYSEAGRAKLAGFMTGRVSRALHAAEPSSATLDMTDRR
jgi:lysophospholipase L1-like esterase